MAAASGSSVFLYFCVSTAIGISKIKMRHMTCTSTRIHIPYVPRTRDTKCVRTAHCEWRL